jgi:general secretion pathway protein N
MRVVLRLLLVLVLLALLLAAAAWYMPASFAYRMFGRDDASVQLREIEGTVREGRAGQVLVNGFPVGALEWALDSRALLRRTVSAQWQLSSAAWQASGHGTRRPDGSVEIDGLRMELPALLLKTVLDVPALGFVGTLRLELDRLRLRGLVIEEARGRARWDDAGVTGEVQARFGPLQAHFGTTAPGHLVGEVEDEGGPLLVDGQFDLVGVNYHAEAILTARDPAHPIAQALYYIGQAMPDGSSLLVVDGQLQQRADGPPAGD